MDIGFVADVRLVPRMRRASHYRHHGRLQGGCSVSGIHELLRRTRIPEVSPHLDNRQSSIQCAGAPPNRLPMRLIDLPGHHSEALTPAGPPANAMVRPSRRPATSLSTAAQVRGGCQRRRCGCPDACASLAAPAPLAGVADVAASGIGIGHDRRIVVAPDDGAGCGEGETDRAAGEAAITRYRSRPRSMRRRTPYSGRASSRDPREQ